MLEEKELFVRNKKQTERDYLEMRSKGDSIHKLIAEGKFKDPQFDWVSFWREEENKKISRVWKSRVKQNQEETKNA